MSANRRYLPPRGKHCAARRHKASRGILECVRTNDIDTLRLLLAWGKPCKQAVCTAIKDLSDHRALFLLVSMGAKVKNMPYPAMCVGQAGFEGKVRVLAAAGANLNCRPYLSPAIAPPYTEILTPLQQSIIQRSDDTLMAYLLECRADPNLPSSHGVTPLQLLLRQNDMDDPVRMGQMCALVLHGAHADVCDPSGTMPVELLMKWVSRGDACSGSATLAIQAIMQQ